MSKFTPGPWVIDRFCGEIQGIGPLSASGSALDDTGLDVWLDVDEANAQLIASAPELYAACLFALDSILATDKITKDLAVKTTLAIPAHHLRAALAKARGE